MKIMSKIRLRIYRRPHKAEAFLTLRRKDNGEDRVTAIVDTGAQTSLLPISLLENLEHRLTQRGKVIIEQAGMSQYLLGVTGLLDRSIIHIDMPNLTRYLEFPD